MIQNREKLRDYETELIRREKSDYARNLKIVEALYKEAVTFGVFPLSDPLEGIEIDIKLAKALNSV